MSFGCGSSQYLYKEDLPAKPQKMATVDGHADAPPVRSESLASDRFTAALANVTEMGQSLESFQHMLGKAVYVDEEVFANASAVSKQTRTVKVCADSENFSDNLVCIFEDCLERFGSFSFETSTARSFFVLFLCVRSRLM